MSAAAAVTRYPVPNAPFPDTMLSAEEREQLILAHVPQVRHIARRLRQRLPESVSIEDLVSTGVVGLIAAIDRFDRRQNVRLTTYAEHKIRGAMLDSLRSLDWAPRQSRKRANQIKRAISSVQQYLGRAPEEDEIAAELGLTPGEYHDWLAALIGLNLESLETRRSTISCKVESDELRVLLNVAISNLPTIERRIMHLHCYEEMPSREIAELMGLSESRISQLKSQAILRLCS
jgi:RNA polymerase sigma factor for flagellar operon FliA